MLKEGFVLAYNEFPVAREQSYLEAEKEARKGKKHLWGRERLAGMATALPAK